MTDGDLVAREVVVHGRVQGVFFRAGCADQADRLGVRGWVRNTAEGTVAAHLEGSPDAVEAIVKWCHHGPRTAVVTAVDVAVGEPSGATRFSVR